MYDRRLRGLVLLYAAILVVVGVQIFSIQVLGAGGHADGLELRHRRPFTLLPRRGEILYADGTAMASNRPDYDVHVAFADLDDRLLPLPTDVPEELRDELAENLRHLSSDGPRAVWECAECGEREKSRVARSTACPACGARDAYRALPAPDRVELAALLGVGPARLAEAFAITLRRRRENEDYALHPLLLGVGREPARALRLASRRFPGLVPKPRPSRGVDPAAVSIVGSTRAAFGSDVTELTDPARRDAGRHVYTRAEVYASRFGSSGLERSLDERLRGVPGRAYRLLQGRGKPLSEPVVERPVRDGETVRTTLRPGLQRLATEICARTDLGDDPLQGAAAVVLDVRDGAVLALASRDVSGLHRGVSHVRPGSVFKLITAVAALEAGVDPAATVDCGGVGRTPLGQTYRCEHVHGAIALREAFQHSCNAFFGIRAEEIGLEAMADACRRLGLERRFALCFRPERTTRAGLEYTSPGSEDRSLRWFRGDLYRIGIGQGKASVSPVQIAVAYARVANGGRLVEPWVLEEDRPAAAAIPLDAALARHSARLVEAARLVVTDGTAVRHPALAAVDAAGKTGTADVGRPGDGKGNNAWFVGFAPYDAPRYVAVVVFERVRTHGASASGDAVAELLAEAQR